MTDHINQEIKIAMIDASLPNIKEIENVKWDHGELNLQEDHGAFVGQSLLKTIKADGYLTNPNALKIQAYACADSSDILYAKGAAEKKGNEVITTSLDIPMQNGLEGENYSFERYQGFVSDKPLVFCASGNNSGLLDINSCYYAIRNNHNAIPVSAIYYEKEFSDYFPGYRIKNLLSPTPGASTFIAERGFHFENGSVDGGSSLAAPKVAGSSGVVAYRYLKAKTQGDFSLLTKKYLGYSAQHIDQKKLIKGWATEDLSKRMRDITYNDAEDCNFGIGLGLSDEHGTGEYDPIAFFNLCESHFPEFDAKIIDNYKYQYWEVLRPTQATATTKISFEFDCDQDHESIINGVYFGFKSRWLREIDVKNITLISPDGSKSELVNEYTSLRAGIEKTNPSQETIEELEKNQGRCYESNRHFGQRIHKGKWTAIITTYNEVEMTGSLRFFLSFKVFDQKNHNMIINNNIFNSEKTEFTYQNSKDELDYFNLSPTSSQNNVNLKERKATLTFTHPHPKIRTLYDLEDYEKSLKEPVTPKVVNVTIDPNTAVDYIADGSGNGKLVGNELSNKLLGLSGDDELYGEEGDDHLYPGTAKTIDKGFGGVGNDTHYVISREPGEYWIRDDIEGKNAVVFSVSYEESIERAIDGKTKEISYNSNYKPLTLDDVKFTKTSDTEYWMQGGNKKVRFDPAEIQSVVLKHSLTGEVRTLDRTAINALCMR